MRHLLALLLSATIVIAANSGTLRADGRVRLAQNTTPAPLPTPAPPLSTQNSTACLVNCTTQAGACQSTCLAISSGVATTSSTAVGVTTNSTQCTLNCTSQQLLCDQGCPQN